ncbi:hypothetical protein PIB30_025734 [Stylosanthes scabra]|uniref:Uncharacterized protein n=1 Tax=Stylosanthes scabra TaxID=79078 RepID=A0ABU6QA23_9FABA|nr:hypothetical protein [Stylosanthes scabra]
MGYAQQTQARNDCHSPFPLRDDNTFFFLQRRRWICWVVVAAATPGLPPLLPSMSLSSTSVVEMEMGRRCCYFCVFFRRTKGEVPLTRSRPSWTFDGKVSKTVIQKIVCEPMNRLGIGRLGRTGTRPIFAKESETLASLLVELENTSRRRSPSGYCHRWTVEFNAVVVVLTSSRPSHPSL